MAKTSKKTTAPKVLLAWVGATDLRAAGLLPDRSPERTGKGPIGQVVLERAFDIISLLYNYDSDDAPKYMSWLAEMTKAEVRVASVGNQLKSPVDYAGIYQVVNGHITELLASTPTAELTYHLSPGTPAMSSVWLLLARTLHPARLIASSHEAGVEDVEVPFRLGFEAISEALTGPDALVEGLFSAPPPDTAAFDSIIYKSEVMRGVVGMAHRVSMTNITTLILGPSGTGKELFARAIHEASPRRGKLVTVNCGAIPQGLLASELFGHEKSAFTGADSEKAGVFERAKGGTVFLDEVGELPMDAQVHLLRVLESRRVRRLGSSEEIDINVRIIAATHRDLPRMVQDGAFREDLFFRLAIAVLKLPPLIKRRGDFPFLVNHLLNRVREELKELPHIPKLSLSPEAERSLQAHTWPGNIRELYNVLLRAALWSGEEVLGAKEIERALLDSPSFKDDILRRPMEEGFSIRGLCDELAGHYIRRAFNEEHGNKTKVAKRLGLKNRSTLQDWMKRCDVDEDDLP